MEKLWKLFPEEGDPLVKEFIDAITRDVFELRQRDGREAQQVYYEELKQDVIQKNHGFLLENEKFVRPLISDLGEIDYPNANYELFLCKTQRDKRIWKFLRITGSRLPAHEAKGRDLSYFLKADGQIVAIGKLGSAPMSLGQRDSHIGWTKAVKEGGRLQNTLNVQTCVALFPFSQFTGGKLLVLSLASNLVLKQHNKKYPDPMVALVTTSLYGKSIQYDRLSDPETHLADWSFLGITEGTRTFVHVRPHTRRLLYKLAKRFGISHGDFTSQCFERDKIMSAVCKRLNLPASSYVETHGTHKRGVYFCPIATNWKEILTTSEDIEPDYINRPLDDIIEYWKHRWFSRRWEKYKSTLKNYDPQHYLYTEQKTLKDGWF